MAIPDQKEDSVVGLELSFADIAVLFFLTPLKPILPFAKLTHDTGTAFRRTVAWRAVALAIDTVIGVALFGPVRRHPLWRLLSFR